MPSIEFFVHSDKPSPSGSKTFRGISKKTGKAILSDACKTSYPWKVLVKQAAYKAMEEAGLSADDFDGPVQTSMVFHMPVPKSLVKKVSEGDPHIKKPDITKLTRAVEDAMTNTVYNDDSQIWSEGEKKKIYSITPGAWVRVETKGR